MHRLVLALLFVIGCGDRTPPPAAIANTPPTDAASVAASVPADAMPRISGGCCQGSTWVCDRMPNPGECPSLSPRP